jgi:hypothetical protein
MMFKIKMSALNKAYLNKIKLQNIIILLITSPTILSLIKLNPTQQLMNLLTNFSQKMTSIVSLSRQKVKEVAKAH